MYTPKRMSRQFDIGVIPHYVDSDIMRNSDSSVLSIDVTDAHWRRTVDRITSCSVVISSSLHGIVVAEAYGVPAVWVQPSNRIVGGRFKFDDYFEGTGRDGSLGDWSEGLLRLADRAMPLPSDSSEVLLGALQEAKAAWCAPTPRWHGDRLR
jgi:hypothetical protein